MKNWRGFTRKWSWPTITVTLGLEALKETSKVLIKDSRYPGPDTNKTPPEYVLVSYHYDNLLGTHSYTMG
jgi:hypothetical protein